MKLRQIHSGEILVPLRPSHALDPMLYMVEQLLNDKVDFENGFNQEWIGNIEFGTTNVITMAIHLSSN